MKYKVSILILVIALTLFSRTTAFAQLQSGDIVLSTTPANPSQNQNVTAILNSFSTDLNKASISWLINGQTVASGIGKTKISFTTGGSGAQSNLNVKINTIDGNTIIKSLNISPADIDMLWEASDSYSPPFYRGRTFPSSEGGFKIVAMPSISNNQGKIPVGNLSYTWSKDRSVEQSESGFGKNSFVLDTSYLDQNTDISVDVSDVNDTVSGTGDIVLNTITPKILFYENDPNLGIQFQNGIDTNFNLKKDSISFFTAPYFFSPKDLTSSDLAFTWTINDESVTTPDPKNILSIKPNSGQSGTATIKLNINNTSTLFQSLDKELDVNF